MGCSDPLTEYQLVCMERFVKNVTWFPVAHSTHTSLLETTLETCDVTFSITSSDTTPVDFKVILSSLSELQSEQGKARVERLFLMEGGEHVAVVLLLDGEDSILSFSNLQAEYVVQACAITDTHTDKLYPPRWLCWDYAMPMIPITTIKAVPDCLESLQRDCDYKQAPLDTDIGIVNRDLVRWCVSGKPLLKDQVNILTGITSGFQDLADLSILPSGQAAIREYLGDDDGGRLVSFLTKGSSDIQGQS